MAALSHRTRTHSRGRRSLYHPSHLWSEYAAAERARGQGSGGGCLWGECGARTGGCAATRYTVPLWALRSGRVAVAEESAAWTLSAQRDAKKANAGRGARDAYGAAREWGRD